MEMLSGKCVLIAVFLQLCFSVHVVKAQPAPRPCIFGDLIVYPKTPAVPFYSHYAVYVGGLNVEGKRDDQNIFEMIRTPTPGCRFTTQTGPFDVDNYLDGEKTPQTPAEIKSTIEELMRSDVCRNYIITTANCEQIATKVRYGEAYCYQGRTVAGAAAKGVQTVKDKLANRPIAHPNHQIQRCVAPAAA